MPIPQEFSKYSRNGNYDDTRIHFTDWYSADMIYKVAAWVRMRNRSAGIMHREATSVIIFAEAASSTSFQINDANYLVW